MVSSLLETDLSSRFRDPKTQPRQELRYQVIPVLLIHIEVGTMETYNHQHSVL